MSNTNNTDTASLQAELERLRAENAELQAKAAKKKAVTLKVSPKGAVSVYGMGRFPVTMYKNQWEQIFGMQDLIRKFIADNDDKLSSPEDKVAAAATDTPAGE